MMYSHNGWSWFWMVPIMLTWIVAIGVVVYVAVRLASRDSRER